MKLTILSIFVILFCFVSTKAQEVDVLFIVPIKLENKAQTQAQDRFNQNVIKKLNKELLKSVRKAGIYNSKTIQTLKKSFKKAKIIPKKLYISKYRNKQLSKINSQIHFIIEGEASFPTGNDIAIGVRIRRTTDDSVIKSTALRGRSDNIERLSEEIIDKIIPKKEEILKEAEKKYKFFYKKKKFTKAEAFSDWGLQLEPHHAKFLYFKAKVLEQKKSYINAEEYYKEALRLRYDNPKQINKALLRVSPKVIESKKEYTENLKKLFREFANLEKKMHLDEIKKIAILLQLRVKKVKHLQKIIDNVVVLKKEIDGFLFWMNKLHGSTISDKNKKSLKDMRKKINEYKMREKKILYELQKYSSQNKIFIKKSIEAYKNKKYDNSLYQAKLASLLNPKDPVPYFHMGISQGKKYKQKDALKSFSKAIDINPKYWQALHNRGATSLVLGRKKQALQDFKRVLKLHENAETHLEIGNLLQEKGKEKTALSHYSKAIQLNQTFAYAYYQRGKIYDKNGNYVKASKDYKKAMNLSPVLAIKVSALYDKSKSYIKQQALIHLEIGQDYQKYGELDEAMINYNKALSLNYSLYLAFFHKGQIYHLKGKYKNAMNNYRKAIKIEKENPYIYMHRAITFIKVKKYNKALNSIELALKNDPNLPDAYLIRGKAYEGLAQGKKTPYLRMALQSYDLAVKLLPSKSHYYIKRSKIYMLLGNQSLAEKDKVHARSVKK